MARQLAKRLQQSGGTSIFNASGYKGVKKLGSAWGWEYVGRTGVFKKGGYSTAEEAAYFYDEFVIGHVGPDADTNQALGLLKPKQVLEIRMKLAKSEKHQPKIKQTRGLGSSGLKGVSVAKSKTKPWKSQFVRNGKYIHIGSYATKEAAARAYDAQILLIDGPGAETNVKLGLLPPVAELKYNPQKPHTVMNIAETVPVVSVVSGNGPGPRGYEMRTPSAKPIKPCATPEDERQAQIEAARLLAAQDTDDDDEDNQSVSLVGDVVCELAANECAVSSEPLPVQLVPVVDPNLPMTNSPGMGELLPAESKAEALRQRAAEMLREAAEEDARQVKQNLMSLADELGTNVKGYQETLMKLIDYGAEIERVLAKIRSQI